MKKKNDLKANINENINNIKNNKKSLNEKKDLKKEKIKKTEIKKQVLKVEIKAEIKIEEKSKNKTIEKEIKVNKVKNEKVNLEEVIEEIIVEEDIIETINNKIVDFVENKCLIIKALNFISNFANKCHKEKTSNQINRRSTTIKENYEEIRKRVSGSKRRKEIIDILDSKYKNKMDSVAREHIIKLYVNDTTRFMVTL